MNPGTDRPHRASLVLELVGRPPNYGWFCLGCSKPWPCPDAPPGSELIYQGDE